MFWPFKKKDEEVLRPGKCECGHYRCHHKKGKGECLVLLPEDDELPEGECACQIYIRKEDDDSDDGQPDTPTPSELEKIWQL